MEETIISYWHSLGYRRGLFVGVVVALLAYILIGKLTAELYPVAFTQPRKVDTPSTPAADPSKDGT